MQNEEGYDGIQGLINVEYKLKGHQKLIVKHVLAISQYAGFFIVMDDCSNIHIKRKISITKKIEPIKYLIKSAAITKLIVHKKVPLRVF